MASGRSTRRQPSPHRHPGRRTRTAWTGGATGHREPPLEAPLLPVSGLGRAGGIADALARTRGAARAGLVSRLQRAHGNAAVQRLIATSFVALTAAATPPTAMVDEESTGSGPAQPAPLPFGGGGGAASPMRMNEWGEIDGAMVSDTPPTAFVSKGKTGSAAVHWGGGAGGKGNQGVGSIDLTAPVYEGQDETPEEKNKKGKVTRARKPAKAWIKPGTGKAKVTRSYIGVLVGANGTYYITRRAVARIDVHEMKHVNSSQSIHNTNIKPLERRVGKRTGKGSGLSNGAIKAEAVAALQTEIDWNTAVTNFSTQDTTANIPMGTTDTTDQGSANFYHDYGPRTVKGTNYAHYVDTPPGPK